MLFSLFLKEMYFTPRLSHMDFHKEEQRQKYFSREISSNFVRACPEPQIFICFQVFLYKAVIFFKFCFKTLKECIYISLCHSHMDRHKE